MPKAPRSYKLGCLVYGSNTWAYNALRFRTFDEARAYGEDLFSRWLSLVAVEPHESDDAPNYEIVKGVMREIK